VACRCVGWMVVLVAYASLMAAMVRVLRVLVPH
jgi:hypothetical protein